MRHAGEIAAGALQRAGEMVQPGISTWEINQEIGRFVKSKGALCSFKGYEGFPGNACISINHELIHGIPSKKRFLREGDIVSIDVGACKDGYHGDNAATFACGEISQGARKLIQAAAESLEAAIFQCIAGNRVGDISNAVQTRIESAGYFIPEDFLGHGVGRDLHEDPSIPNIGKSGRGTRLVPGMTLAIEPMVHSTTKKYKTLRDGWTIVEGNGNMAAHCEHTVLITTGEPVVLTKIK